MVDWGSLSPEKFEEFCWFVLESEGYVNITRIGGSGDRGRDIVAERVQPVMTGKVRTEKWILQAKRYVSAPPSPGDFDSTFTWASAHKPFGLIFAFPHRLTPATHDWLAETASNRALQVVTLDLDFLESFLERSNVARARFFPGSMKSGKITPAVSGWFDSSEQIANTSALAVYTAGKMAQDALRGAMAAWRKDLEKAVAERTSGVGFLHPELVGCDHSGIALSETVEADRILLRRSDLVVGLLDDSNMPGTLVELMIALESGKSVGIFLHHKLLHEVGTNFYSPLYGTRHSCDCMLYHDQPDFMARNPYWFFLTYVHQVHRDAFIQVVDDDDFVEAMADFIEFQSIMTA